MGIAKLKNKESSLALHDILNTDEGYYGYLFPYRKKVPKVTKHIFTDLKISKKKVDQFIVDKMLDIDYIGWTAKVVLGLDLFPIQIAVLQTLWKTPFPLFIASRGGSKSFTLAVYAVLKALLDPGAKIVIVGAGLRQAKLVFAYIENIWNSAPVLRSIVGGGKNAGPRQNVDLCYFKIGPSIIQALPMGDGSKIRGFRATCIIADEFASIPEDIFDVVVRGFTATTKTPVDEARRLAIEKKIEELGIPNNLKGDFVKKPKGNQIIYSGTAYYQFNHFAKKFDMWKDIISSKGDMDKIAEIFGGKNNIPDNFDPNDYALIRLPSNYLPDGLLDKRQLAHAKATLPKNIYDMEYNAIFIKDSDGYFPRSLIESCTIKPSSYIVTPDGEVSFTPMMRGIKGRRYVIGIDPGAERDRLAITILEGWKNHYRVVYCWSTNKDEFNKCKKQGFTKEHDYYAYCCAKIRVLVNLFNPIRIEMDSQGGGYPISEMLRTKKGLDGEKGEFPIYEVVDPENIKEFDGESDGPHILSLVQQSNEFNAYANGILHKSLETQRLLFPAFDTVIMQAALIAEKSLDINSDTYEECVYNIEELKNELCTIQRTETTTGKERFDTPTSVTSAIVEGRYKKGRLRKDRYTSLLLAHKYIYSVDVTPESGIDYNNVAGNFKKVKNLDPNMALYHGPGIAGFTNAEEWMRSTKTKNALQNGDII